MPEIKEYRLHWNDGEEPSPEAFKPAHSTGHSTLGEAFDAAKAPSGTAIYPWIKAKDHEPFFGPTHIREFNEWRDLVKTKDA